MRSSLYWRASRPITKCAVISKTNEAKNLPKLTRTLSSSWLAFISSMASESVKRTMASRSLVWLMMIRS